MDCESEDDSTTRKGGVRKRKENAKDDTESDFPCLNQKRKLKRKKKRFSTRTADSTEDEAERACKKTPESPKTLANTTLDLVQLCSKLTENSTPDLVEEIQKRAVETQAWLRKLEHENEALKKQVREKSELQGKIDCLDNTLSGAMGKLTALRQHFTQPRQTYAQKLRVTNNIAAPKTIKPNRNLITIFPKEGKENAKSEDTKKMLIASLAPVKEKLQIRSVRMLNKGGVMVETETREDLKTLLEHEQISKAGLKVELPTKRRPLMIIYGVDKEISEKELLSAIRHQNLEQIPKSSFHEEVVLKFKTGDKSKPTVNWVIEVSPKAREILRKKDRIFIGWNSCPIKDFIPVSRCYRCQSFGHVAKYCREKSDTCGHCGEEGHSFQNCTKKNEGSELRQL